MECGHNVRTIAVEQLSESPMHAEIFRDLPDPNYRDLVALMRSEGQLSPVQVLPGGQVIHNWREVRAARELGIPEVDVIERRDLRDESELAIKKRIIRRTLSERQFGVLEEVWLFKRLNEQGCVYWARTDHGRNALRVRLGQRLSMCGRNLDRHLKLLRLPLPCLVAVSKGELDMTRAGKILGLPRDQRQRLGERIREHSWPKTLVDEFLAVEM